MTEYTISSFFSGAGGLDRGFHNAGFTTVYANEFDRNVIPTYEANFTDVTVDPRSLFDVAATDTPDGVTGIIGGPPCQSWSLGGLGQGLQDKRGAVFLKYIEMIQAKQPMFFIAENVKGMLAKTRADDLQQLIGEFDKLGYNITFKLLNASDYGVPQDRERVFFVGYRKDLGLQFTFPEPDPTKVTIGETISHLAGNATPALEYDRTNGDGQPVPYHEYSTGSFSSQFMSRNRIRNKEQQSFTIQASGRQAPLHYSSGGMVKVAKDKFEFVTPEQVRRYTVKEASLIQTFPDDYVLSYEKLHTGYKMIGNAVPVVLAERIAQTIHADLENL